MELEERALLHHTPSLLTKAPPPLITAPAPTLDGVREVTRKTTGVRASFGIRAVYRFAADCPRRGIGGRGELRFSTFLEKQAQGTLDDRARIAVRDLAAEESWRRRSGVALLAIVNWTR
jgi:hypothetical protein